MIFAGVIMELSVTREEYLKNCEAVLGSSYTIDDPSGVATMVAKVESLAYLACKYQALAEQAWAKAKSEYEAAKAEALDKLNKGEKMTALEKDVYMTTAVSPQRQRCDELESEVKRYRSLGRIIENKVSLAQSLLSNARSEIRAGYRAEQATSY